MEVSKPVLIYQQKTAWDSFDVNVDTPSEANTIHRTYDISYQTIKERVKKETEESFTLFRMGFLRSCSRMAGGKMALSLKSVTHILQ